LTIGVSGCYNRISRAEVEQIARLVAEELENIHPGFVHTITGGFVTLLSAYLSSDYVIDIDVENQRATISILSFHTLITRKGKGAWTFFSLAYKDAVSLPTFFVGILHSTLLNLSLNQTIAISRIILQNSRRYEIVQPRSSPPTCPISFHIARRRTVFPE
jgi:hypothetical protein